MARIIRQWTVVQRGLGKPDYTRKVSSGQERAGLRLEYLQGIKMFAITFTDTVPPASPYFWVRAPLAIGGTAILYDMETGLTMDNYTLPAGWNMAMMSKHWSCDQDTMLLLYMDGVLVANQGIAPSGSNLYTNEVMPYQTVLLDPAAALPHIVEFRPTNLGGAVMQGGVTVITIIEPVGTGPLPTTKRVKCTFCGHDTQIVPTTASRITCEACGMVFIVYSLVNYRGSP